jgi:hypothetical protein
MNTDPFASSTVSLISAWVLTVPFLLGALGTGITMLFEKLDDQIPRWFVFWIMLCVFILSPLRYMILQVIMATAYPVQSLSAFLSVFLLALYVPIVFGLLYFVGVGLPLLAMLRVAFGSLTTPIATRPRPAFGSVLAPFAMGLGYFGFFWPLQYGAYSVHWLHSSDVIGATNGPAEVTYAAALKYLMLLPVRGYYNAVTQTDRDTLRNHVASYYLGRGAEARYMKLAYPDLYKRLAADKTQ